MGSYVKSKQKEQPNCSSSRLRGEVVWYCRSHGGGNGCVLMAPISHPKHLLSLSLCLCCCFLCQTHPINSKSKKKCRNFFFYFLGQKRMNTSKTMWKPSESYYCVTVFTCFKLNMSYINYNLTKPLEGLSLFSVNF